MAVFGLVCPGFCPHDDFEIDVEGVIAAGTRVDTQYFLGLAPPKLADGTLPTVGKRNRQSLIHHLCIVIDAKIVAHVVDVVPIAFLWLQSPVGRAE